MQRFGNKSGILRKGFAYVAWGIFLAAGIARAEDGAPLFAPPAAEVPPLPEDVRTAEWIEVHAHELDGQVVRVAIERASPSDGLRQPEWKGFYCFTPAGSINVLVPLELAPAFFERYGTRAKKGAPHILSAIVETTRGGSVFLRVRAATSQTRVWTSLDGRRVEADYQWSDASTVTIRRVSDGRTFTMKLSDLSLEDRAYVAARRP